MEDQGEESAIWERSVKKEEKSPAHYPLAVSTASTLFPEQGVVSPCTRPTSQLTPTSELKLFPKPADPSAAPSPPQSGSQVESQPDCKIHAVDNSGFQNMKDLSQHMQQNQHNVTLSYQPPKPEEELPGPSKRYKEHVAGLETPEEKNSAVSRLVCGNGHAFNGGDLEEVKTTREMAWRGCSVQEEKEEEVGAATAINGKLEDYGGRWSEEQNGNGVEEEESVTFSPLASPKRITSILLSEKRELTEKRPPIQLMPIPKLESFPEPTSSNNRPLTSLTGSQEQPPPVRRHGIQCYQTAKPEHNPTHPANWSREHGVAPKTPGNESSTVFRCLCGSGYPSKGKLHWHIQKSRPKVSFKCTHCPTEFSMHFRLASHIRKVHQAEYDAFGCHFCGAICSTKGLLMRHQDNAHGIVLGRRSY